MGMGDVRVRPGPRREEGGRLSVDETKNAGSALDDIRIHVRIKIAALWASVMFCYIYADYFGLYVPGRLQGMLQGRMGPLGTTTQGVLLATSLVMAIPSVMIFLTLALPPRPSRSL